MRRDHLGAIVGVAESDLGVVGPDRTALQLQAQAARAALEEAGLTLRDVDAVFSAGGESWSPTMGIAEYLGITPRWSDGTNIGGSSFDAHVGHAVTAIRAGRCEVALLTYGSTQRPLRSPSLARSA